MAKIAVVDDSNSAVQMLESILKADHHNVTSYTNADGLEDKLASVQPDLLLLDIVMPGRSGYEVLRALRRNTATKDIPVIFVSSKGEDSDVTWGMRQGAVNYITKPYTPEAVRAVVGKHL